jgi:hypothetical protein
VLLPEDDFDVEDEPDSPSSDRGGKEPISENADPRLCDRVAEPYPNFRLALPFRRSGNDISGVGDLLGPTRAVSAFPKSMIRQAKPPRHRQLTESSALLATPVVTRCLYGFHLESLRVPHQSSRRHGTPALRVRALLAGAACPATSHTLELAILEGAVCGTGLRGGEANVLTRRLVARVQINER